MDKLAVKKYLEKLQNEICVTLSSADKNSFLADRWERAEGGGGESRLFSNGSFIEKGGVNFSHVFGNSIPTAATIKRPELVGAAWEAMGVSVVIHPSNPHVPTVHMNVRFFSARKGDTDIWWFGGGYDLTPFYGYEDDCIHWHCSAKKVCDKFSESCLLYTSPSPRDVHLSRMPSSA